VKSYNNLRHGNKLNGGFMPEVITTELKSDLERIYKITGDILNALESGDLKLEASGQEKTYEWLRFGLEDIEGTLQKDIFNCDYLITRMISLPVKDEKDVR
jgi:hypothetical protein